MTTTATATRYPECFGYRDENSSVCQKCPVNSKCLVFQQGTSLDVMGEAIKLLLAENNLLDSLDSVHVQSSEDFIADLYDIKIIACSNLDKVEGEVMKTMFLLGTYDSLAPIKAMLANLPAVIKSGVSMDEASLYSHKLAPFGVDMKLEKVKRPKKKVASEFAGGRIIGHLKDAPVTAESLTHPLWIASSPRISELENWKLVFKEKDTYSWIFYENIPGESGDFELVCSCPVFMEQSHCPHVTRAVSKGFPTMIHAS